MSEFNSAQTPTNQPSSGEQFPVFEKLFSQTAQTRNAISMQTIQKLFFSIKVTAYFDYLKRYDPFAPHICAEVLKYSAYTDGTEPPSTRNNDVTIYEMLQIVPILMSYEELCHAGYFLVDMLLIRPFALYAEKTGQFRLPDFHMPDGSPDDEWDPFISEEVPF